MVFRKIECLNKTGWRYRTYIENSTKLTERLLLFTFFDNHFFSKEMTGFIWKHRYSIEPSIQFSLPTLPDGPSACRLGTSEV
jgi:hypothetical protein